MELTSLLDSMREAMYEPIAGLRTEMSSPSDIGISTGAPTGGGTSSQASLEGLLTLDPAKLAEALRTNPAGVEQMLQQWSQNLQGLVDGCGRAAAERSKPGSTATANQITQLSRQISDDERNARSSAKKRCRRPTPSWKA